MAPHDAPPPDPPGLLDRLRSSWFPPAAILGAFAVFTTAAFRGRSAARGAPTSTGPGDGGVEPRRRLTVIQPAADAAGSQPRDLPRAYAPTLVIGRPASTHRFQRSLGSIGVGARDTVWALADDEVQAFDASGALVSRWSAPKGAACLTVARDERVYIGSLGRVDLFDAQGRHAGGFSAGEAGKPAQVTAIGVFGATVLVADAAARVIRRYDAAGREVGQIGSQLKTGGFMLPNGWLDVGVDASGTVWATDSGRHRVTAWALDGTPKGVFGAFGHARPQDFVGCCNPVNLAVTPDGKIVTAEKMIARVKVFEPDGTLLAFIGPEHFDQGGIHLFVQADSRGRLVVGDIVRRTITVFERTGA